MTQRTINLDAAATHLREAIRDVHNALAQLAIANVDEHDYSLTGVTARLRDAHADLVDRMAKADDAQSTLDDGDRD